jgi:hypothetical protein
MVGAALIHPDRRAVMPLRPAPRVNGVGTDNNDGARQAAKRLVAKLRQDHPHLKLSITAASLRSNAPHMEPLHPYGYSTVVFWNGKRRVTLP